MGVRMNNKFHPSHFARGAEAIGAHTTTLDRQSRTRKGISNISTYNTPAWGCKIQV